MSFVTDTAPGSDDGHRTGTACRSSTGAPSNPGGGGGEETSTTQPPVSFSDVPGGAWYAPAVQHIAQLGVTTGYTDGTYRPDLNVTRAQMAVFLVRALDLAPVEDPTGRFGDVAPDAWYAPHVERLAQLGITAGCGDGTDYCPGNPVTRSEMALFLQRVFDLAPAGYDVPSFDDVGEDHFAYRAIEALNASGITAGCGADPPLCCPARNVTRAQMAAFLSRAITRAGE